jgi:hypothetical protein
MDLGRPFQGGLLNVWQNVTDGGGGQKNRDVIYGRPLFILREQVGFVHKCSMLCALGPMLITKPQKYRKIIIKWDKYSDNMWEKKFAKCLERIRKYQRVSESLLKLY